LIQYSVIVIVFIQQSISIIGLQLGLFEYRFALSRNIKPCCSC